MLFPSNPFTRNNPCRPINFVMISPHFPANFETFAVRLRENGFNTLGIADAPYESLSEEITQLIN